MDYNVNEAVFNALYEQAGGLKGKLSPGQMQTVKEHYKAYLDSKFDIYAEEIEYTFRKAKFKPEVCTMSLPLTIKATATEYPFTKFQTLENTLLLAFWIPVYTTLLTYVDGTAMLAITDLATAYLTMQNDRMQDVRFREPLVDYFRDTAYMPDKCQFDEARMSWDTTKIIFPSGSAVPAANVGKIIAPMVAYIDMKRYPFVKK